MKFSDYIGDISIDVSHLQAFVQAWYKPDDIVVLVAISVDSPRRKVLSQAVSAREILDLSEEDIHDLCITDKSERFNTYISVFPVKDENSVTMKSRGTKEDVEGAHGVYADLDVKEGGFTSKEEILEFLQSLALYPTVVVDNGKSGGVHAYWRLDWGQVDTEEILEMWFSYLQSMTERKIDKLIDVTRILRMPSGIYWPKKDSNDVVDTVKVVINSGNTYSAEKIKEVSMAAFEERKKRIGRTIDNVKTSQWAVKDLARDIYSQLGKDTWTARMALANIERTVNNSYEWSEILDPFGWTYLRRLRDGSHEWARPGRNERSAVTDYDYGTGEVSPVMSLLSMSEETGLSDLKEAEIPLSKYRVLLRLHYQDDEKAMLNGIKDKLLQDQEKNELGV